MQRHSSVYAFACGVLLIGSTLLLAAKFSAYLLSSGSICGAAVALGIVLIPGLRATPIRAIHRLDQLTGRRRIVAAVMVGTAIILTLAAWKLLSRSPLMLLWHDEFQFHLQSQLLARFRLWMPPHPLTHFFDTFYVLIEPKYAPQSFPGAAMLFVPTVWLNLPTWVMPLLVSGAACGLLWWVLAELIDNLCATTGIVVLVCTQGFERISTMYMAQIPMLMLGLAAFVSMMRWRRTRTRVSAAMVGFFLGFAAITRPLDALCYGVIVLLGMIPVLVKLPRLQLLYTACIIVAAATPFLAIQAVFDYGITGSVIKTPFTFYNERDQPALGFGSLENTAQRPLSDVPQKQRFYDSFTLAFVHLQNNPRMTVGLLWSNRLFVMRAMLAPALILLPFAMVGLLGLTNRTRLLLFALAPLFVLAYHEYPIFLFHYVAFAWPALILLYSAAPQVVGKTFGAYGVVARRATAFTIIGMSLGAAIERNSIVFIDDMPLKMQRIHQALATMPSPAIVLFTAPATDEELHLEPVYNDDVAWPDDAPIIRAHDRGIQNTELFDYYARRSPDRTVWRYDRRTEKLTRLGDVRQLASQPFVP